MQKLKVAVLASGGGTNLQSIIDQTAEGKLDIEIVLVVSNNPGAGALERAQKAGIPFACIDHRQFSSREEFDQEIVKTLHAVGTQLVVLAGFMRIITDVFLQAYPMKIINIHPSLLPAFPGLRVHRKAIEYGARFSGCTVHFVDGGVDSGPIIIQAVVPIHDDDNEDILAARILEQEHIAYPQAIQWIAEGRVLIDGRRVTIKNSKELPTAVINPPLNI